MSKYIERPQAEPELQRLKDFQRRTVDHAFHRLYDVPDTTRRFLVADEVGLGKTLVARGIIAKAIEHLWDRVERIDIVYICSNTEIARQNIGRLHIAVPGDAQWEQASRITLLPITVRELSKRKVNFVSFTPGTSFDLKSSTGVVQERALLYVLLERAWGLTPGNSSELLRAGATRERFDHERQEMLDRVERGELSDALRDDFILALETHDDKLPADEGLRARLEAMLGKRSFTGERSWERNAIIGELRAVLAQTCLKALEPDLVILDEFQRFKSLLHGEDDAAILARELFDYEDATSAVRVLLLSATPYKMYTLAAESSDDSHYEDFLETLRFLEGRDGSVDGVRKDIATFRHHLHRLGMGGGGLDDLVAVKSEIETRLRRVMARSERLAVTEERDGMLVQMPAPPPRVESQDLRDYLALSSVAKHLEAPGALTYWKTAPYLLNFMEGDYQLKRELDEHCDADEQPAELIEPLERCPGLLLPWDDIRRYGKVDPRNARLRELSAQTLNRGVHQLLWVPPSLAYYGPAGPYAGEGATGFTKRLVFSGWRVVPKVIATLLTYEAERAMIDPEGQGVENTPEARKARRPLLRFAKADRRLTGMPVLALLYPSRALARWADPLTCAIQAGEPASLDSVLEWAERRIAGPLGKLTSHAPTTGPEDETWYWLAPILLDLEIDPEGTRAWLEREDLAARWRESVDPDADESATPTTNADDEEGGRWAEHVDLAKAVALRGSELGRPPEDLTRRLAQLAVAGPATCSLRALWRVTEGRELVSPQVEIVDAAAQLSFIFWRLFNQPEVTSLVRHVFPGEPYWTRVLEYCAAGNIQAMLDEYAHVLIDLQALFSESTTRRAQRLAAAMHTAFLERPSNLAVDELRVADRAILRDKSKSHRMRARFAVRLQDETDDATGARTRTAQVRDAFNGPFWPFVLATTSIGQEGLDFHPYAHAIVHWDLPSNPVDLEQREGRLHRYKGHAVRKNLARRYGFRVLRHQGRDLSPDPWRSIFQVASAERAPDANDLVPFWVFPVENGDRIERHVPAVPWSRDTERLTELRRSLAVYRMVFGQPRQDDLVEFLLRHVPKDDLEATVRMLRIDLTPR